MRVTLLSKDAVCTVAVFEVPALMKLPDMTAWGRRVFVFCAVQDRHAYYREIDGLVLAEEWKVEL